MRTVVVLLAAGLLHAQSDPAYTHLEKAYAELRVNHYDIAIAEFKRALELAPDRPSVHKDLAYTLLKTGETEAARDEFAAALKLDPGDDRTALEYGFLCYETKQPVQARRTFDRLRENYSVAEQAFENIDRPLREGIARWTRAVEIDPANFSAQEELARLFEQRDDPVSAAAHFAIALKLRPDRRSLLLDLGRVWKAAGRAEDAMAALLAASRGAEPRTAELARELLPARYPYVYEFHHALELDPSNITLRRELAYLHLEMGDRADAEREFEIIAKTAPADQDAAAQLKQLRSQQINKPSPTSPPTVEQAPQPKPKSGAKEMGMKSLDKGFLRDAVKYLQVAHEEDPLDFEVMLKLGWAYNLLKLYADAIRWFDFARRSPDTKIASEAGTAYRNLQPNFERFRTTIWAYPMFSTRWHDLFAYAQIKTELRVPKFVLRPYASIRFIGDSAGAVDVANLGPQYLSERSVIVAAGLATKAWHGATGWFEAGEMLRYSPSASDPSRFDPDYRGGVSFGRGIGNPLARGRSGFFADTTDDGIFVSRFDRDTLLYSQNRTGYTLRATERAAIHAQLFWNFNATVDAKSQYWANYVETGPGLKFRFEQWHVPLQFSISALRGAYLINQGNPRGPNFNDIRAGVWYAWSR